MVHTLPPLPYPADALEPHIDAATMRLHHGKHHQTYVDKLNAALEGHPELAVKPLEGLLRNINEVPEAIRAAVRNHGGGHANHSVFWTNMRGGGESEPRGALKEAIRSAFGDTAKFRDDFTKAALALFGSGWVWLVSEMGVLNIVSRPNQDSPLMDGLAPLLGLDVWEHAYYLQYQNRRSEYVSAWWQVVNWEDVAQRFSSAARHS